MTRIFILALLFCLTTLATAQTARHEIGVILGPTSTHLKFQESDPAYESRLSFVAGIKYRYIVTQRWSLTIARTFERKGFKITSNRTNDVATIISEWTDYWDFDYFVIPLSVRYDLGDFFVSGGGYYGYLYRQRVNFGRTQDHIVFNNFTDWYYRSDAGISASAGFRVNLATNWFLETEVKYSHGLANIVKPTFRENPTLYTRSTALTVGLSRRW